MLNRIITNISWKIGLLLIAASTQAATVSEMSSEPFGEFNGTEYQRVTGRFEGTTSMGDFAVPFEVVGPVDLARNARTVLFEAPHWSFAPLGRDLILGRNLIFNRGISYAAVGFGVDGGNILDPAMPNLQIADMPVADPGDVRFSGPTDVEIIVQFIEALCLDPHQFGQDAAERVYAYGVSRSADALMAVQQTVTGSSSADIFDLTLLHNPSWEIEIELPVPPPGGNFDALGGPFVAPVDVGRVMFLQAEGDHVAFNSEVFRSVANLDNYRIYEVAGAAHLPTVPALANMEAGDNPLDHWAVMRALFVAGHDWMRSGTEPPANALLESAPAGEIDPVYDFETGIARDADGNALGGIRLPDLVAGRRLFIASDPETITLEIPFLAPLTGSQNDLECTPRPDGSERFDVPRVYDWQVTLQTIELVRQGFLLQGDAVPLMFDAVDSAVGRDERCSEN